jgi:hypothetical protein
MEVTGMMPACGALTSGGQRWNIGAAGFAGGRLTTKVLEADASAGR